MGRPKRKHPKNYNKDKNQHYKACNYKHELKNDKKLIPMIHREKVSLGRKFLFYKHIFERENNHPNGYLPFEKWKKLIELKTKVRGKSRYDSNVRRNFRTNEECRKSFQTLGAEYKEIYGTVCAQNKVDRNLQSNKFDSTADKEKESSSSERTNFDPIEDESQRTSLQNQPLELPEVISNEEDEELTEEWQRRNWTNSWKKENLTLEINEIVANKRFFMPETVNGQNPSLLILMVESMRKGVFVQDWTLVAKCIEGAFEELRGIIWAVQHHWIYWNAGFLSLMRFAKNDREAIKEFARAYKLIFNKHTVNFYARRIGVEVAIWLTQQGFFNEGLLIIEEMEARPWKDGIRKIDKLRILSKSPKRHMIDLMTNLIKSVFLYAVWRRDIDSLENEDFEGTEDDVKRTGETALSAFEGLLELVTKCQADVTTFLEPLMELTIEYRSPTRAKSLFKELVVQYYGNAFIEEAYVKFIEEHFPHDADEDFINRLKLKDKFVFTNPPEWLRGKDTNQSRVMSLYREKRLKEYPKKLSLKKIPNPGFSW